MKYRMKVTIVHPNCEPGMLSDLFFDLSCFFSYDKNQYGNGHYVLITGEEFYRQVIDLRYDAQFNPDRKEQWLETWARSYWSGVNGAYAVKSLKISKMDGEEVKKK